MGFWIELRCENRDNPSAGPIVGDDGSLKRCYSHNNRGPGNLADDTRESVLDVLRDIEQGAKGSGWVKTKYG